MSEIKGTRLRKQDKCTKLYSKICALVLFLFE